MFDALFSSVLLLQFLTPLEELSDTARDMVYIQVY